MGNLKAKYNIVMDKEAFIKKIKPELYCDYLKYYKNWEEYEAYIFGCKNGDFGEEQVLLRKDKTYRLATEEERLIILDLI